MSTTTPVPVPAIPGVKHVVWGLIVIMMIYVMCHNERFLIDPKDPAWQHYATFRWWLLPHGVAGACALLLAPLQFSDRLRRRFTRLHRIVGRVYVGGVFVLAPLGAYIQYIEEPLGMPRSLTVASGVEAVLLLTTTAIGLAFALKRMIPRHRQWMTRSYAVALVFFEGRFIIGVTHLDRPLDLATAESILWACLAMAVLIGDLANQWYELQSRTDRRQPTLA